MRIAVVDAKRFSEKGKTNLRIANDAIVKMTQAIDAKETQTLIDFIDSGEEETIIDILVSKLRGY